MLSLRMKGSLLFNNLFLSYKGSLFGVNCQSYLEGLKLHFLMQFSMPILMVLFSFDFVISIQD